MYAKNQSLIHLEGVLMGFAVLGSSGSYVTVRDSHQWNVRFRSFTLKERFGVGFKLVKNFKDYNLGSVSLCKGEVIDFEERTSPNEVNPMSSSPQTSISFGIHF